MKTSARDLDRVDQITLPLFAATMLAEHRYLKDRPQRTLGDLADADLDTLSGPQLPADELVPLGYERRDTMASLGALAGSIAMGFAFAPLYAKVNRFLFRHRISNVGQRKGSIVAAMVLWDFLYYWDHRWMHEVRLLWGNHVTHHSSERYNLSTALRQPWSSFLTFWVFAPMPLLGLAGSARPDEGHHTGHDGQDLHHQHG